MEKPILKVNVRILRPSEFEQIMGVLGSNRRAQLRGQLITGARYIENKYMQKNPQVWDGKKYILLPREGSSKKKSQWEERTIRLSNYGIRHIESFFDADPLPANQNWDTNIKNWAEKAGFDDITGLCAKTTRKTWEAWLFTAFEQYSPRILASQGHTQAVALKHYLNLPFYEKEKREIMKYVDGWI